MTALRIGCWNIRTGAPTAAIRRRLSNLRLNVVLFQEVDLWTPRVGSRHVVRELFESRSGWSDGDPWAWAFGPSLQSEPVSAADVPMLYGNLVAVRGRIDECLTVDLGPLGADPFFHDLAPHQERRTAVLARVRTRSRNLVVATTHLRYGDGQCTVRQAQTQRLLSLLDRFALPDDVVVLAADFNATATEIDRWALPPTWRRATPVPTVPVDPARMRLGVDHVLMRGGRLSDLCSLPADGLSDHLPIVLTVN